MAEHFRARDSDAGDRGKRTIHGLWNAIGRIVDLYSPMECSNYFDAAGYDAD